MTQLYLYWLRRGPELKREVVTSTVDIGTTVE